MNSYQVKFVYQNIESGGSTRFRSSYIVEACDESEARRKGLERGHRIEKSSTGEWRYTDTNRPIEDYWTERDCGHCGKPPTVEDHDACLGTLPGVAHACCGHGDVKSAYIEFDDGRRLEGLAVCQFLMEVTR